MLASESSEYLEDSGSDSSYSDSSSSYSDSEPEALTDNGANRIPELITESIKEKKAACSYTESGGNYLIYQAIGINQQKTIEILEALVAEGCPIAMVRLAYAYELKHRYRPDSALLIQIIELYQKAIALGNTEAMNRLGHSYKGVIKDDQKARELYEQSSSHGDAEGMYQLGFMYEYGHGVDKDLSRAKNLYLRSLMNGYIDSLGTYMRVRRQECHEVCGKVCTKGCTDRSDLMETCLSLYQKYPDSKYVLSSIKAVLHDDDVGLLFKTILENRDEINRLKAEVTQLQAELDYQPGGQGYEEARQHFNAMATGIDEKK